MQTYFVYRHYAKNGELLYVGLSGNVIARHKGHRKSPWFDDVSTVKFEMMETTKKEALEIERNIICKEKPKFNKYKRWNEETVLELKKTFNPQLVKEKAAKDAYWSAINDRKNEVKAMRKSGMTWTAIGKEFGVTRQRAQQIGSKT